MRVASLRDFRRFETTWDTSQGRLLLSVYLRDRRARLQPIATSSGKLEYASLPEEEWVKTWGKSSIKQRPPSAGAKSLAGA